VPIQPALTRGGLALPAWIASALSMLFGTGTRAALTGATAATLAGTAGLGPGSIPGIPDIFGGDGDRPRRRRRRRALTASDRADIAFVAGLLGPKAGKDFATIIGARTAT